MTEFPELPHGFVFGTATAAYQVEGAVEADGRGRSVWDTFCAQPGNIKDGETGEVACDHYHRHAEDVALMRDLGMDAYRFSLSWPRIQPEGTGAVNPAGLDFYDRLVDELLAAGISPVVTVYHWDLPQPLQDAGGWQSRATAQHLADYAAIVGARLGDRVRMWVPVNEPVVVAMFGYALGVHAPGLQLGARALPVAHHLLLGHGLATQALRAAGCHTIGTASNHAPTWPASDSTEDRAAAALYDTAYNWLFADPVLCGSYPDHFAEAMPGPVADDLHVISTPLDFYGINYYQPTVIGAPGATPAQSSPLAALPLPDGLPFEPRPLSGHPTTDFGWAVAPEGLTEVLQTFRDRYAGQLPPLYVTESGCAVHDVVGADGQVHDPRRTAYHRDHLRAVAAAIADGVDVRGYFVWSTMDNFEWAEGYRQRFGLVHVDFATLRRTPKDSYRWFQQLLAARP
ncbi:MAG TPA: GH1 family beta-glucosidase [Segeticoccus sp.]|uniref:GH1 family beta-glucosidase n=1 Tax=Segeticoccus sp. TaxID=2706531 RepID=UPI002D7EFD46|nr:GH1 family beta-glucosidase [Segeticoccus sp.]HET8601250.1 GH1 family beta-glucosidase [Segeticoccus sp.]